MRTLTLILAALSFPASALSIDVFTYAQVPVSVNIGDEVRYYEIDAMPRAMDALSEELKVFSPEKSEEEAIKFLMSEKSLLEKASEGLTLLQSYQLHSIPAVVFNQGEAVVYGASDVRSALSLYEKWKGVSS